MPFFIRLQTGLAGSTSSRQQCPCPLGLLLSGFRLSSGPRPKALVTLILTLTPTPTPTLTLTLPLPNGTHPPGMQAPAAKQEAMDGFASRAPISPGPPYGLSHRIPFHSPEPCVTPSSCHYYSALSALAQLRWWLKSHYRLTQSWRPS